MLNWFAQRFKEVQEKDRKGEKGFTLIELLVVIIIIGILAAIAIPVFLSQREQGWEAAAQSNLRNAAAAATACSSDDANDGSYSNCGTEADLDAYGYNEDADVDLTITAADDDTWAAEAVNSNGGATYEFDTDTGQVREQ